MMCSREILLKLQTFRFVGYRTMGTLSIVGLKVNTHFHENKYSGIMTQETSPVHGIIKCKEVVPSCYGNGEIYIRSLSRHHGY